MQSFVLYISEAGPYLDYAEAFLCLTKSGLTANDIVFAVYRIWGTWGP